jgi:hypothetical protein
MKTPKVISQEKGPLPEATGLVQVPPTLIWPSIPDTCDDYECDRNAAPLYYLVKMRHDYILRRQDGEPGLGCDAFWNALHRSEQILVIDTHLSRRGMIALRERIFESVSMINDLRVITAENDVREIFNDLKRKLKQESRLSLGAKIEISIMMRNSPPLIHDRFAVTDGELWHFGGTVGGEQKLTAVSRGWNASAHRFLSFFNEAWDIAQNGRSTDG